MQRIDTAAIETFGIPRLLLMEHAGLAVAQAASAVKRFGAAAASHQSPAEPPAAPSWIVVCCGTGYNGGDGLSAARHLEAWGFDVRVLLAGRLDQLREEPALYATMLQRLGIAVAACPTVEELTPTARWFADCALVIDALLGIGVRGPVREPMATLIEHMNRSRKPIIAADIPSGLDADTGLPQGCAVRATVTVAFGLPKHGCFVGEGPAHVGELIVDPITIPRVLLERA